MSIKFPGAFEELLDLGLEDMLSLEEVFWVTSRHLGLESYDPASIVPTLDVISRLLRPGYAIVGELDDGADGLLYVRPWGLSPDAAIERITEDWGKLFNPPNSGSIVWFELTDDPGRAQSRRNRERWG